jgi:hypothetical protein
LLFSRFATNPALFEREILPAIRQVPLRELMQATGLSLPYVSQIRRGEKVPHPQHWSKLREVGGLAKDPVGSGASAGSVGRPG